jgi:deoxycytidine triphosphate deaminase
MLGSILSDLVIRKERTQGNLIIEPFKPENLTNVAIDVTLGSEAVFIGNSQAVETVNISNKSTIRDTWKRVHESYNVEQVSNGILLHYSKPVLCHTYEFVGSIPGSNLTTMLRARSTLARAGVTVCPSAGWGDVGYHNRWAVILTQTRADSPPVFIPFGERIAQIVFLRVSSVPSKSYSGSYNSPLEQKRDFGTLLKGWDPLSLLP